LLFRGETVIEVFKAAKALLGISIFAFGLGFLSTAQGEGPSKIANQGTFPTNLELLKLAVEEAIEEVCDRLPLHEPKIICLGRESEVPGNWLVEHAFSQSLLRRSFRVLVPDTLGAQPHPACTGQEILYYRVVDLDLIYLSSRRKHLFGPLLVHREARLRLLMHLGKDDGEILWTGEAQRTKEDWVPAKMLEYVEGESLPFISPQLKPDGWSRIAEPALLSAVVGGLIYLFYTTQ
jgi:hypothetical protein